MRITFDINGKVAIITGGTSGIGYSTAEELLKRGATVVITGRNEKCGAEAAEKLAAVSPPQKKSRVLPAHAVIFLIENESTTGLSLVVDGGYTAQ